MLETKLHIPKPRRGLVARPRLSETLSPAAQPALTLVSAPAGFGKTTLLAEWMTASAAGGCCVAWLSLDPRDNDPALFWTYVIGALRVATPDVGATAASLLQSSQPPVADVLATLLNDLGSVSTEVVLVLDDYHVIESRDIHDGIAFLLDHLPSHVHLVIAGRSDPPLSLARLRARGELIEIRAGELRFTPEEAAEYLNGVMGLALTVENVSALEARTEGWIAALQLAALSIQGRDDVAGFIAGFAGDDRFIVDYLAEEVLARQPEHIRRFLLQTSILQRLTGSLCEAVTGLAGGQASLAALERGNLFLVPLDDRRQWYRYHQLFADVLQAHLHAEQGAELPELHLRASVWFEQNGELSEAVRHALAAQNFDRAANLVERALPAMGKARQEAVLLDWLSALPDEVIRVRPVLSIGYAGALMSGGQTDGVERRLADAQRWLDATPETATGMVVADADEFRRIPGMIQVYQAGLAMTVGDGPRAVEHASRALELLMEDDSLGRAAAAGLLGITFWSTGELAAAHRAWSESLDGLYRAGHVADTFGVSIALADIRITQGRLNDAMRTYRRALQVASQEVGPTLRGTADMYVGMAELHIQRNELDEAGQQLLRSKELGEHAGLAQNRYRWCVAMAGLREAQGDLVGAVELLNEAQRRYAGDYFPNVRPVPAQRARLFIAQGNLAEAGGWVREQGISVEDELSYLREFEHITLARLLVARSREGAKPHAAGELNDFLARLLRAAEAGERTGRIIEILTLQALAHHLQGNQSAALTAMHRAVTLAEPEDYVRIFVDEGPRMAAILKALVKRGADGHSGAVTQSVGDQSYVRRILAAFDQTRRAAPDQQRLIEALSERELDVLRLLGTELVGPDIARELFISVNTLRTHTKNIYAKLGVNNRRAAVRRGQELDLLATTS